MTVHDRLRELGIDLPAPPPLRPTIAFARQEGNLVYVSGRGPLPAPDGRKYEGKVGRDLDLAEGKAAARLAGVNLLVALQAELGNLDRVRRCLKLTGFVNCEQGFAGISDVLDSCSELLLEVFGAKTGRHARTAIGVSDLPNRYPVEVDLVVGLGEG
jgi:enamine deaminase RidA (YjgF/YER057c/UK114 family)